MTDVDDHIACELCGAKVHVMKAHLEKEHPGTSVQDYRDRFPGAPLLSEYAKQKLEARKAQTAESERRVEEITSMMTIPKAKDAEIASVFGLKRGVMVSSKEKKELTCKVIDASSLERDDAQMLQSVDADYVMDPELLKCGLMGMELNIPTYFWGHMGTGKSSMVKQLAARTNRPMIRVQHTGSTEESHILGQWTVRDGRTIFEMGPLAVAMRRGWVYLADEYDFAMPQVLSLYQPVLEGEALVIKEADAANRVIHPHPNFRFFATGNTNGVGDETGLYQGTNIQNAANYERFGIVVKVEYLSAEQEKLILIQKLKMPAAHAELLVRFANDVRREFDSKTIGTTISPRALLRAGKIGMMRGDYKIGLALAFWNRCSAVDRQTVEQLAQRIMK